MFINWRRTGPRIYPYGGGTHQTENERCPHIQLLLPSSATFGEYEMLATLVLDAGI